MVEKFGSWTAFIVAHPLVIYWIWGEPIHSLMDQVVPPGSSKLTRSLLDVACPTLSAIDRFVSYFPSVFVALCSLLAFLFPNLTTGDISICLRKRFCYDRTVSAIENGARQVLILGGGYDVLMLNLAQRYPHVLFAEIDHPFTSIHKRMAVEKLELKRSNTHFLAIDLSVHRLEDRIANECPEWDTNAKSVVVAEGLLMYLLPDQVKQLLRSVKTVVAPGSTLVFSYILNSIFKPYSRLVFRLLGEQLMWTPNSNEEVMELVGSEGFQVDVSPNQSDNYLQYLAADGRLPRSSRYKDRTGIAIIN